MSRARPISMLLAALALTGPVAQADEPTGGVAAPVPPPDGPVVVVGDSLAVGMRATFDGLVAPRPVTWNVKAGITTPQGLLRLRQTLAVVTPAVVVVSLGTNDGPDPRRFRDRLRRVMGLVPADACVVWPDIYRPARKGPYTGLNRVLREEARRDGRLVVVGWQQLVRAHRVALPDGLHPDPAGFDARSRLVGAAVAGVCGS